MPIRKPLFALALVLLLGAPLAAAAQDEPGDPIIRMDSTTKFEIDLAVVVEDLLPRLLAVVAEEDPEEAAVMEQLLEFIGIRALQGLEGQSKQDRDRGTAEFRVTLDPAYAETPLYRLLTTPNGECRFARHVPKDDVVMFMTIHNLPHYLGVVADALASPELAGLLGDVPVNADGDLEYEGFAPRRDLLPLMSGEFDVFMLEDPAGESANPWALPFFMVLGATDGPALRDALLGILGGMAGGEIQEMLAMAEIDTVGEFELMEMPMGGALAVSPEFLVVGLNPDLMRSLLAGEGDLKVPDGIEWVYLDGPRYGGFMDSMMGMAAMMDPDDMAETAWMMGIYDVLFDHIHSEEILYRSRKDGFEGEVEVDGPVMTGMYRMLPVLLDKVPELVAMEHAKDEKRAYRDAVHTLDQAFMAYAEANDGTYPADPAELVGQGYIEEWPYQEAVARGGYADWGYTYETYVDEEGAVVGYIFILYGGGETGGYDVFSATNVEAEGPFAPEGDGTPDGVAGFCYDGTAIPMVDEFLGR